MNPFTLLHQQMLHSRTGHMPSDALMLLAPLWAGEYVDDGTLPKDAILRKLNDCPPCKLVQAMRSTVQSLPL